MKIEDVEEITGDENWELDIETNYQDIRFFGDKIWVEENENSYFVFLMNQTQSYKKKVN